MKKIHIALIALFLIAANGFARENSAGGYIGLGLGTTSFLDGGLADDINDWAGYTFVTLDDSDAGAKLYGGYQFNKVVAIEASITNYGEFRYDHDNDSSYLHPKSYSVGANVGYSIKNEFRPYALLGLSYVNMDQSDDIYEDDTFGAFRFGFGFQWEPREFRHWGFRVAYEGDFFAAEVDNTGIEEYIEDTYYQALSMFYVGAQFKF
jgi:opacity protein-like surface antigen